jgi:hypothetical protein
VVDEELGEHAKDVVEEDLKEASGTGTVPMLMLMLPTVHVTSHDLQRLWRQQRRQYAMQGPSLLDQSPRGFAGRGQCL